MVGVIICMPLLEFSYLSMENVGLRHDVEICAHPLIPTGQ